MENVLSICASAVALVFASVFLATLVIFLRGRNAARRNAEEIVRPQAELEKCRQVAAAKEEALQGRLADKDEACQKLLAEREKAFAAAVETLKEQFANIALTQMKTQSEGLSKANLASLNVLLAPLRDQVKVLQELAGKAKEGTLSMAKDVLDMGKIAKSLQNVATALTSNTSFQGRKGEDILAEKLRQAGLEENVNFFLQQGTDTDRPDAQVRDTENRWLIIDSKVSLTAYMEYANAADETTKAAKLAQHVASVRQKIDQLAKKKYPHVFAAEHKDRNYLPITAMFVPYEAPLMAALKAEPSLWQYAAEHDVILVTPLTLLAYIRLVYLAWQHEKELNNQREIVDVARELLARMNNYLMAFEKLGKTIDDLQGAYQDAKGIIVDSPRAQTIAKSANRLIGLHVKLESRKGRRLEKAGCLQAIECDSADSSGDAAEIVV